ncbi:DUF3772 domain-containing protein [Labrys sp. KB_33_2]|uniref:DUF3772 domain-containing protein n=1 Tax=Labrys sp. KB_33_2 TaxID=3237479 RepID=UPI003F914AFC
MFRSLSRFLLLCSLLLTLVAAPMAARAQDAEALTGFQTGLALDKKSLDDIATQLATITDNGDEAQKSLQDLRETVSKRRVDLAALLGTIIPARDKAKAALDAFPPQPKPVDPPEAKATTEARKTASDLLAKLNDVAAETQKQISRADQIGNTITVRPFNNALAKEQKSLDDVEAGLTSLPPDQEKASKILDELRGTVDTAVTNLSTLQAKVSPLLDQSKARLAQLGEPDPSESADIAETRATQNDLQQQLKDVIKRAGDQSSRAAGFSNTIIELQREQLTGRLLKSGDSPFSAEFWVPVLENLPRAGELARNAFSDHSSYLVSKVTSTSIAIFLLTIAIGYAVTQFLRLRIQRWRARLPRSKRASRRYVASLDAVLGIVHIMLGVPVGVAVTVLAFGFSGLLPENVLANYGSDLIKASSIGVGLWALAQAVLAEGHAELRLLPLSDWAVRRIGRRMGWLAVVLSLSILLNGVIEHLHADPSLSVARETISAILYLAIIVSLLIRIRNAPPTVVDGRTLAPDEDLTGLDILRPIGWLSVVVMAVCLAIGYSTLAVAAAVFPLLVLCVVAASYLLTTLVDSALTERLISDVDRRRAVASTIGVTSKQVTFGATLLSGVLRFLIISFAVGSLGLPFGLYSTDMAPAIQRAYFGFKIGELTISPSSIISGIVLFIIIWAVMRLIKGWLGNTLLPRTSLDSGVQNSIATIIGYLGFILAISAGLSEVGVSWQNIGIVAGGLSVGLGLGLQGIAGNFVSGLILLAERPIRVGDIIAAAGEEGYVRRISVRSTTLETYDRATLIIPNSTLITGSVKNWVYGNTWSRLRIALTVLYDSDIDAVKAAMLAAPEDDPRILPTPRPQVYMTSMDVGLEFELIVMVASMETQVAVKSDLLARIFKNFRAKGIRLHGQGAAAPPQRVILFEPELQAALTAKLKGDKPEAEAPVAEPTAAKPSTPPAPAGS